jgi:hypothetical protein
LSRELEDDEVVELRWRHATDSPLENASSGATPYLLKRYDPWNRAVSGRTFSAYVFSPARWLELPPRSRSLLPRSIWLPPRLFEPRPDTMARRPEAGSREAEQQLDLRARVVDCSLIGRGFLIGERQEGGGADGVWPSSASPTASVPCIRRWYSADNCVPCIRRWYSAELSVARKRITGVSGCISYFLLCIWAVKRFLPPRSCLSNPA